jgi:hypothetical protein
MEDSISKGKMFGEPISDSTPVKRPIMVQDKIPKFVEYIENHTHLEIHFLLSSNLWSIDLNKTVFDTIFATLFRMANSLMPKDSDLYLFGENICRKQEELLPPFCRGFDCNYIRIILHAQIYADSDLTFFRGIDSPTHPYSQAWKVEIQRIDNLVRKHHGAIQTETSSNLEYTWMLFLPVW